MRLAAKQQRESPWSEAWLTELRHRVMEAAKLEGRSPEKRAGDQGQYVHVRLLQVVLDDAGDPDCDLGNAMGLGAMLGVVAKLPRCP